MRPDMVKVEGLGLISRVLADAIAKAVAPPARADSVADVPPEVIAELEAYLRETQDNLDRAEALRRAAVADEDDDPTPDDKGGDAEGGDTDDDPEQAPPMAADP